MTHYKYGIGGCQLAETICYSFEKMHLMNRNYVTKEEWDIIKQKVIDAYQNEEWEAGGYGDFSQFDFIK